MEIKVDKISKFVYIVRISNYKILGTFELDHDGFYKFWKDRANQGFWEAHTLRAIADKLDEVNKPYIKVVEKHFTQEQRDFEERARVEYRKLLNESGMFFEFYPTLTGQWKEDKKQWFIEYAKLEDLRDKNKSF